jgi:hypothetical protein
MRGFNSVALLAAIALLSAGPSAQSLADAARRASTGTQTNVRKYTNDDVQMFKAAVPETAPAAPEAAAPDAAKTAAKPEAGGKNAAEETAAEDTPKKPAPYVVNRIAALKGDLQIKQKQLAELKASNATADAQALQGHITSLQKELAALETRLPR